MPPKRSARLEGKKNPPKKKKLDKIRDESESSIDYSTSESELENEIEKTLEVKKSKSTNPITRGHDDFYYYRVRIFWFTIY